MELTKNQLFQLILGDIAMAMAIQTYDATYRANGQSGAYVPGSVRDDWMGHTADKDLTRRVVALANAGIGSLSKAPAADLLAKAERFGIPVDAAQAEEMAEHFDNKRNAVLVYNR